jgi:16S rRNA (cytosine1402-N4)-methyltransferase
MKTGNFEGEPVKDFYGNLLRPLKPLQSKPIVPSEEEIAQNNRARSARMRIASREH